MQINARLPNHPYPRRFRPDPSFASSSLPSPRSCRGLRHQRSKWARVCVLVSGADHESVSGVFYVQWAPSSPRSLDAYPRIKSAYTLATLIWCNYYTLRGYTVVISTELFFFFVFVVPSWPAFRGFGGADWFVAKPGETITFRFDRVNLI